MTFVLLLIAYCLAFAAAACFTAAMLAAADERAAGTPNDIRPNELHHIYLGLVLLAAAAPLGGWRWVLGTWLAVLCMADDAYEHMRQLATPAFQSPLHRLFGATLWRVPGIPWLAAQLNRLLGKAPA